MIVSLAGLLNPTFEMEVEWINQWLTPVNHQGKMAPEMTPSPNCHRMVAFPKGIGPGSTILARLRRSFRDEQLSSGIRENLSLR